MTWSKRSAFFEHKLLFLHSVALYNMQSVLIVDDSKFMRTSIRNVFDSLRTFSKIEEAEDGHSAIEIYKKSRPDIVTMDVEMPGIDGVVTAKQIIELNPKAKVIMVTSIKTNQVVDKVRKIPQIEYLTKPIDPMSIKNAITKINKRMG